MSSLGQKLGPGSTGTPNITAYSPQKYVGIHGDQLCEVQSCLALFVVVKLGTLQTSSVMDGQKSKNTK